MADGGPLLSWETSANTQPETSTTLPDPVTSCLHNARYLHLATCAKDFPHISLMNYTFLEASVPRLPSLPTGPVIIMTTNPSSRKTLNLISNPNVSLLVHDWVSHRPPNTSQQQQRSVSPPRAPQTSGLASLLMGMNTSALGSISATVNGLARVLESGSEEEKWCQARHMANNTFEDEEGSQNPAPQQGGELEDVRVVVVRIRDGRIADRKGGVRDWVLSDAADDDNDDATTNGIR